MALHLCKSMPLNASYMNASYVSCPFRSKVAVSFSDKTGPAWQECGAGQLVGANVQHSCQFCLSQEPRVMQFPHSHGFGQSQGVAKAAPVTLSKCDARASPSQFAWGEPPQNLACLPFYPKTQSAGGASNLQDQEPSRMCCHPRVPGVLNGISTSLYRKPRIDINRSLSLSLSYHLFIWPWVKIQIAPPVNIQIPAKIGPKLGGAPKTPRIGSHWF